MSMNEIFSISLITVKFNDADPLGVVWHGNYVQYFEDAREDFGAKYGIGYLEIFANGFVVPVVSLHCDYKKSLRYGDIAAVKIIYKPTLSAKINFDYEIKNHKTNEIVAVGSTSHVFLEKESMQLQLVFPEFFVTWQKKIGVV